MNSIRPFLPFVLSIACVVKGIAGDQSADAPMLGIVQAFREVVLSSPVDELVADTPFEEGQAVREGDVVLKLRDSEQQLEVKRSAAVMRKAEFDASASRDLVREKIIAEDKGLEQEVRLELAKLECETARLKADERSLRSPISGIVTKRLKEKGESVGRMEPVIEVMEIDRVYVMLNLPEGARANIHQGAPAEVKVISAGHGKAFSGKVDFIDPVVNPGSGLFRLKILVENSEALLRPGMRAEVRLLAATANPVSKLHHQETSGGVPKDSSKR
jgi:membrane fusion protein (multidrug efflux system)